MTYPERLLNKQDKLCKVIESKMLLSKGINNVNHYLSPIPVLFLLGIFFPVQINYLLL